MKKRILGAVVGTLAFGALATAQSPYLGQDRREIKALSQQDVEGYLSGKGLGYAKAAELNHYPGPRHVLDLAKELALTDEQTSRSQAIFNDMQADAAAQGKALVEKEQELDRRFADGSIDAELLKTLLSDIGKLQTQIRYIHLRAHLEQKALLTKHQIHLYDQLRGYEAGGDLPHRHSH
jgi:Spy/CpxP family protein refolding chaperone